MAAATANVHNSSFEICPRVIVSQLDDIVYHFIVTCQRDLFFEMAHPRAAVQRSRILLLTLSPASHCLGKPTRIFWVLLIIVKYGNPKARIEGTVDAIGLEWICLDCNARLGRRFEHLVKSTKSIQFHKADTCLGPRKLTSNAPSTSSRRPFARQWKRNCEKKTQACFLGKSDV